MPCGAAALPCKSSRDIVWFPLTGKDPVLGVRQSHPCRFFRLHIAVSVPRFSIRVFPVYVLLEVGMKSTRRFVRRALELLLLEPSAAWSDQQGSRSIVRRKNRHLDGAGVQGPTFHLPKVFAVPFIILEMVGALKLYPYIEGKNENI